MKMTSENQKRVGLEGLPDRRYNENNWWRSKVGVKAPFSAWVSLAYTVCQGERPDEMPKLGAEEYEEALFR